MTNLRTATPNGQGFPVHSGVIDAIIPKVNGAVDVKAVFIDGFTRQNVILLNAYEKPASDRSDVM
jgi:hypothetical protein